MSVLSLGQMGCEGLDLRLLIDLDEVQRIQDEFADETGLAMITVDSMGTPVTRASGFSALCRFLRRDPQIRRRCMSCDAHGGLHSALEGRAFVYQCHAGLVDLSVSIMLGSSYLGAILCGQVLLRRGQAALRRVVEDSRGLGDEDEVRDLFDQLSVVDLGKLHTAAEVVVKLVNDTLGNRSSSILLSARTGPSVSRLQPFTRSSGDPVIAPLPLVQMTSAQPVLLDADKIARNLRHAQVGANLEVLNRYLDELLPRWSQKIRPVELAEFEDLLIELATGEGEQHGRDISQNVIRHRNRRRSPMNRYECQVYCERLLIKLHNLVEPVLEPNERTIGSLINEIEKDPTGFLTVSKAAEYFSWSESHFARKFKQVTGQTFIGFVTARRLQRAKLMLAHTTKPVLRIAAELDFQPVNYFSRTFKKHTGLTPSQYRQHHLAGMR